MVNVVGTKAKSEDRSKGEVRSQPETYSQESEIQLDVLNGQRMLHEPSCLFLEYISVCLKFPSSV